MKHAVLLFVSLGTLISALLSSVIVRGSDNGPGHNLSKREIEQLLNAPESDQRQKGAELILNAVDFDTTWAFETIIKGIQVEQDYLERSEEFNSGYVWISWYNIQQYVRDLALLGSHPPGRLEDFGENLPADQKTWVLIAQGYQQVEAVHDKLREIIAQKGNPAQKAMAVEAISQYKDTSDIIILFNATLDDENCIYWAGQSDLPGFNPVVLACVIALRHMGYTIEWDSKEFRSYLKKTNEVQNK